MGETREEKREREREERSKSETKGNTERVETKVLGGDSDAVGGWREREETFAERNESRRKSGGAEESVAGAN